MTVDRVATSAGAGRRAVGTTVRTVRAFSGATAVSVAAVLVALLAWQLLSGVLTHSLFLATPVETARALWSLLGQEDTRSAVTVTLERIAKGLVGGGIVGSLLGLSMGLSSVGQFLIEPYVRFFRFISPVALVAPAVGWLGVNENPMFVLVVYGMAWPIAMHTAAGVRSIVPDRVRMARTFSDDSTWLVIRRVVIPSILPHTLTGLRLGLSYGFMSVIGLEMVMATTGLGELIYQARVFYNTDVMFAGIFILGLIGFVTDRLFALLTARMFGRYHYGSSTR